MRNLAFNHFNCVLSSKPFLELFFCSVTQGVAEVTVNVINIDIIYLSLHHRSLSSPFQATTRRSTSSYSCKGPLRFILSVRATVLTETLDEFFSSLLEAAQQGTHLNQSVSPICPRVPLKCLSRWPQKVF